MEGSGLVFFRFEQGPLVYVVLRSLRDNEFSIFIICEELFAYLISFS